MRDRKKPEEPQEEGSPAWMNTYGDMVTLLLTFFVLLFSFSTIDAEKWEEIVNSLSGTHVVAITALDPNAPDDQGDYGAGKFVITSSTPTPTATPEPMETTPILPSGMNVQEAEEGFDELYHKINNYIEDNGLGYLLYVEYTDDYTILLRMSNTAFFDPGQARLDESSKAAIKQVGGILMEYSSYIHLVDIEGHTDNVPIENAQYEDNWELSYDRADTVRKYLLTITDLAPSLLNVSYYGEYQPIASNDTAEGRARNRRVDFVIESILKA